MIRLFCKDIHRTSEELFSQCEDLLFFSRKRLDKCRYQEGKTTCTKCPTHCL
ncbi:MAG: nitrous oxide-stimulated promoter family protein [Thermodesulfobacteriota bacterium]|nr:nitrous oxide-stimulated promoter family protein [Thermodesulfobacteriota bacterium]